MTVEPVDPLRIYFEPAEISQPPQGDGYPYLWHDRGYLDRSYDPPKFVPYWMLPGRPSKRPTDRPEIPAIKDLIRERDGHRCLRCRHPYEKGLGRWSPCDDQCTHGGPKRLSNDAKTSQPEWLAEYRILTVHHLNGVKEDLRWWNLVSLCQRCHLTIQGRVVMERPYYRPHSDWFRPFAAAYYAERFLGLELSRNEVEARLDELLDLQLREEPLF